MVGELSLLVKPLLSFLDEFGREFSPGLSSPWSFRNCLGSRKTKITDLYLALSVHKEVSWLDVSVDDICGVHEVHRAEHAVDD